MRHAGAEGRSPQVRRVHGGLGPRLPANRSHLVRLDRQEARVRVLDERRNLTEAETSGEGGMHRRRPRLVDVAEPAVRGDRVENRLGIGGHGSAEVTLVEGSARRKSVRTSPGTPAVKYADHSASGLPAS
jgi:hypothetical protein